MGADDLVSFSFMCYIKKIILKYSFSSSFWVFSNYLSWILSSFMHIHKTVSGHSLARPSYPCLPQLLPTNLVLMFMFCDPLSLTRVVSCDLKFGDVCWRLEFFSHVNITTQHNWLRVTPLLQNLSLANVSAVWASTSWAPPTFVTDYWQGQYWPCPEQVISSFCQSTVAVVVSTLGDGVSQTLIPYSSSYILLVPSSAMFSEP